MYWSFLKNSANITKSDKEAIQQLMDLVAEERKYVYGLLAEASKVSLGLEGRLQCEKDGTAAGINRLKAVTKQSDDRAVGFSKCIDSWQLKHSKLKKSSTAASLIASKKGAARERIIKEQVKSVTKESKNFMDQLRSKEKENGKVVDTLTISQRLVGKYVYCMFWMLID